jgi:hypothetical protein
MAQEGPKHVGVKYKLQHFMFLINSAFVGKIFLYLSKCTVKQQLKLYYMDVKLYVYVCLRGESNIYFKFTAFSVEIFLWALNLPLLLESNYNPICGHQCLVCGGVVPKDV